MKKDTVKYRILHVDDSDDFLIIFSRSFKNEFEITSVNSGQDALKLLTEQEFDVLVADYEMPEMNGLELLEKIRNFGNDIPVIFNTGQGNERIAREAFIKGAADYFTKDIFKFANREKIINSIKRAAENRIIAREKHESETRFRHLADLLPQTVFETDRIGNFTYSNRFGFEISGYTQEDMEQGVNISNLIVPEDRDRLIRNLKAMIKTLDFKPRQFNIIRKDGTTFPGLIYLRPIFKDSIVTGFRGILVDITERKEAEQKLKESEEKFRALIENSSDGFALIEPDGSISYSSPSNEKVLGWTVDEEPQRNIFSKIDPDDVPRLKETLKKLIKHPEKIVTSNFRCRHKDGSWRIIETMGRNLIDNPKIGGIVVNFRDITEKVRAQEAILESEHKFKTIFESTGDSIFIYDFNGRFIEINSPACERLGYSREELLGMSVSDITPFKRRELINEILEKLNRNGQVIFDDKHMDRMGNIFPVEISSRIIEYKGKQAFLSIARDVTERIRAMEHRLEHIRFLEELEKIDRIIRKSTDLDQLCQEILEETLLIFNCDRTWLIYPCDPDAPSWKVPMECTSKEFPGAFSMGKEISMTEETATVFRNVLAVNEPLVYDRKTKRSLPDSARVFHVQSQMITAVYPKIDKPWIFGMHQCSYPRVWTDQEKALFKEIGHRLADALSTMLMLRNFKKSEERMDLALKGANLAFWVWDIPSDDLYVNKRWYEILGYEEDDLELKGGMFRQMLHRDDLERFADELKKHIDGEIPFLRTEIRVSHKQDKWKWILLRAKIVKRDNEGGPVRIAGTNQDITERKEIRRKLIENEIKYRTVFESSIDGILAADVETKAFIFANPSMCSMIGYTEDELKNMCVWDIHPKKTGEEVLEAFRKQTMGQIPLAKDIPVVKKDGTVIYCDIAAGPMVIENRNISVGFFRDVTARKEQEDELRRNESRFRTLAEAIPVGILIYQNDRCIHSNPKATALTGFSRKELAEIDFLDLIVESFHKEIDKCRKMILADIDSFCETEVKLITKEQGPIWTGIRLKHALFDGIDSVIVSLTDITKRKVAQKVIRNQRDFSTRIIDGTQAFIFGTDEKGLTTFINPSGERITGYRSGEIIGKNWWKTFYPGEDYEQVSRLFVLLEAGDLSSYEMVMTDKSGNKHTVSWNTVNKYDDEGNVVEFVGFGNDITQQRIFQEELIAKNRELDDFAHRVSHDLKGPLNMIGGLIYTMQDDPAPSKSYMNLIVDHTQRLVHFIDRLLKLSRSGRTLGFMERIKFRDFIEKIYEEKVSGNEKVDLTIEAETDEIYGDPDSLKELFSNLFENSVKYRNPEAEEVRISLRLESMDESSLIVYKDNGMGIEEKYLKKIFSPGFVLSKDKGTGFGLSISRKIVKAHDGEIYAESAGLNKGTTFIISLPKPLDTSIKIDPKLL